MIPVFVMLTLLLSDPGSYNGDRVGGIDSSLKIYEFLDFRFDGSREDFLRQIRLSSVCMAGVSPGGNTIVTMLGADWGLNLHRDSSGEVRNVILMTSRTGSRIYERALGELAGILGEPYMNDPQEERILWMTEDTSVQFRSLHTEEGGWTVIIEYRYL